MTRRRRRAVWPLVLLGLVFGLVGLGCVILRLDWKLQVSAPHLGHTTLVAEAASFITYGVLCWLVALGVLLIALIRARRRAGLVLITALVLAGLVLQVSWIGPLFIPGHRVATTRPFTVMSLNLYNGQADPQQVVDAARGADIVVLVELTAAEAAALRRVGWSTMFPYRVGDPTSAESANSAVYSRWPVKEVSNVSTSFQQWVTRVQVPEVGVVTVAAAHPGNPTHGIERWMRESAMIRTAAIKYPNTMTVIAGDFNAVNDHAPMLILHRDGFRDAADVAGSGWLLTWPANRRFPPLVGIDHVMINQHLTSTDVHTVQIAGTDHRAMVATLAGTG